MAEALNVKEKWVLIRSARETPVPEESDERSMDWVAESNCMFVEFAGLTDARPGSYAPYVRVPEAGHG